MARGLCPAATRQGGSFISQQETKEVSEILSTLWPGTNATLALTQTNSPGHRQAPSPAEGAQSASQGRANVTDASSCLSASSPSLVGKSEQLGAAALSCQPTGFIGRGLRYAGHAEQQEDEEGSARKAALPREKGSSA